jgi:hypothetical protein
MPWGEQAGEWLVEPGMARHLHRAGEEAAVEQVEDRVLDATDILVDRQPAIDLLAVGGRGFDPRVGEAREVPGRIDETSMVSVSRVAGSPHCGQATCFQVGWRSSGLPGRSKSTSSGSVTGRSLSGTGTMPQRSQWITGIGQPQ